MLIDAGIATKVLELVDYGLVSGLGKPEPGSMCVEAAVCYALGLPHGDDPQCVSPALRSLKIALNDSSWSSKYTRAAGMRRLAVAQLGSKDILDDKEFARRCVELAIRKYVPKALRSAATVTKNAAHKVALEAAALRCETEGTQDAAEAARSASAADAAYFASATADAAYFAASSADAAAAYAADAAAAYAADAADAAAYAAAAAAAADAAASSAPAPARVAVRDKVLGEFAEDVVQILIEMKAPGCQWLYLTEKVSQE
jgi:hypothetical protein